MIEFFRRNRRGVVGLFVVGMCVFLMLPFGLDYFQKQSGSDIVVTVGDKKINEKEYYVEVERVKSLFKRQFGAQYEQFEKMINVKQKVLDEMVDKALLGLFFTKLGFVASTAQVEAFARTLPVFSGGVDRNKFQAFLRAQGLTESEFEKTIQEKLSEDQLSSLLGTMALYPKEEREARFKRKEAKVGVYYAKITTPEDQVKVEKSKVEEYFNSHRSDFKTERKILPMVVRFSPERYSSSVNVDEQELVDTYKMNQARFEIPRKVRYETLSFLTSKSAISEIIEGEKADEDKDQKLQVLAEEIRKELLTAPDKFKEIGQAKGATYKSEKDLKVLSELSPDMKNIVAGLRFNEISEVVKLGEEFILVKVVEEIPSSVRPYEEVKEDLRRELVNALTPEYAKVASDSFLQAVENKGAMDREAEIRRLAEEKSLILEESKDPVNMISDLDLPNLKNILESSKGEFYVVASSNASSYVFIYIKDIVEPREKDLESVRSEIELKLRREESIKVASQQASGLLLKIKDLKGSSLVLSDALKAELSKSKYKVESVAEAKRETIALDFIPDPKVKSEILSEVESRGFYSKPYSSYTGEVYLIGLSKIDFPSTESMNSEMESFMAREQKSVSSNILSQLITYLKSEIKPVVSDRAGL